MTTLPTRLLKAAEALAEDLPVGTEAPSDLEGDVRLDERDAYCVALMREAAEELQTAGQHFGEPVTWERLRDSHSAMLGVEPWHSVAPNEGHRVYRQSATEACFMCAALARIKQLEAALSTEGGSR